MKPTPRTILLVLAFVLAAVARPAYAGSPPTLNSIGDQTVAEGVNLNFTVTATDPDGDTLNFFPPVLPPGANFDAATHAFTWTPTFAQAGTYPGLTFGVSDGTSYASETVTLSVLDANRTPTATAGGPYAGIAGSTVLLSSAGSTDPDGTTLTSSWNFGDGSAGSGALAPHVYTTAGTFPVTLTVSDGVFTATASTMVTVAATAPESANPAAHGPAVTLMLTPSAAVVVSGSTASFSATAQDAVGNLWDATSTTTFSSNDPWGSVFGSVYSAGRAGSWTVQGDYGGRVAQVPVTVMPGAVSRITVNPSSDPEEIPRGTTRTFMAEAFDAAGNPVTGATVTWNITNGLGTVSPGGAFTASKIGSGAISATVGTVVGTSEIRVMPAPAIDGGSTIAAVTPQPAARSTGIVLSSETSTVPSVELTLGGTTCTTLPWWGWLGVLLGYYLVLVGVLYGTRRVRRGVYWVLPLALTVALLWGFYRYRCDTGMGWFPWAVLLGGFTVALFRPLPKAPPPSAPTASQPSML
jgi:hypothetical protein